MVKIVLIVLTLVFSVPSVFAGDALALDDLVGTYRILIREEKKTVQVDYTIRQGTDEVRLAYRFIRWVNFKLDWGGRNCKATADLVAVEGETALEISEVDCGSDKEGLADLTVLNIGDMREEGDGRETEMLVHSSKISVFFQRIDEQNFGGLAPVKIRSEILCFKVGCD